MLFDLLFLVVTVYFIYCLTRCIKAWGWGCTNNDTPASLLLLMCVIVSIGISVLTLCRETSAQIRDVTSIEMVEENIQVYEKKYNAIGLELKTELSKYPEYEKEIFNSISPEKMSLYFVKYPELKSIQSVTILAKELMKLRSTIYDKEIEKNKHIRDIQYRNSNRVVYSVFMPRYKVNYK